MRFRTPLLVSYSILILFILLLLGQQSLASQLTLSILFGIIIIFQIVLVLIDDEFSVTHGFVTGTTFLSLVYLVINMMGAATLASFFLGGLFIVLYLLVIVMILIHHWHKYRIFDRMIESMRDDAPQRPRAPPVVPVEHLIDEPPHVRLRHNDDHEWVEIKVKKTRKSTRRKAAKKKVTRKKAQKNSKNRGR